MERGEREKKVREREGERREGGRKGGRKEGREGGREGVVYIERDRISHCGRQKLHCLALGCTQLQYTPCNTK